MFNRADGTNRTQVHTGVPVGGTEEVGDGTSRTMVVLDKEVSWTDTTEVQTGVGVGGAGKREWDCLDSGQWLCPR